MRMVKWFAAAVLALVAVPALAQVDEKSANLNVGGGYTFTAKSEAREKIGDGYNLDVGFTMNLKRKLGVQVEYSYHDLGSKRIQLPVSILPERPAVNQDFFANVTM